MKLSIPGLVLIIGAQGSGKSHLLRHLIYSNRKRLSYGIVFSHTAFNEGNLEYIPSKYVYSQYNPTALQALMKIQSDIPKHKRKSAFVLLDDCVFDSWINCKVFSQLATQLRHYDVLLIITSQHLKKIPAFIRENASATALFQMDTENSIKAAYECYGQRFNNEREFKKFLFANTLKRQFVYYEKNSDKPYMIMKAPQKVPKFKLKY